MPGTRKLRRPTEHRMAMLRGMVTYLLEKGSIQTTETRAKEVRSLAEKMITIGKANTIAARRQAMAFVTKEDVVKKLFDQIAPEYADRNGGYTRIYKLGPRRGDGAEMAIIELISDKKNTDVPESDLKNEKKKTKGKKSAETKSSDKSEKAEKPAKSKTEPKEKAKTEEKAAEADE